MAFYRARRREERRHPLFAGVIGIDGGAWATGKPQEGSPRWRRRRWWRRERHGRRSKMIADGVEHRVPRSAIDLLRAERREGRTASRELHGITLSDTLSEKVDVPPDVDLRRAHEEGRQLSRVPPKRALSELAAHGVHAVVGLDPEQIVSARRRELLEQDAYGRWLEVWAIGKDACDSSISRRIDEDPLPRPHVPRAQCQHSEDGDVEGHGRETIGNGARAKAPRGPGATDRRSRAHRVGAGRCPSEIPPSATSCPRATLMHDRPHRKGRA